MVWKRITLPRVAAMPAAAMLAAAMLVAGSPGVALAADEGGGISVMPFDPDLAIFTAVVFSLLFLVLWKFAWRPISEALDRRESNVAANIAAAEQAGADARNLIAQYEAKLAGAADEVRQLLEEARRDAEHTKQEILKEAKAGAQVEYERQARELRTATDAALKQLAEASAHMAVELAGRLIRERLTPSDHERLIREAVEKFPLTAPSKN